MRIILIVVGKTTNTYLQSIFEEYQLRLKHYVSFDYVVIPELKNVKSLSQQVQKDKEGEAICKLIDDNAELILLDDKGKEFTSIGFSQEIEKMQLRGSKKIVFVVGGPYGFSQQVYNRANSKLSLSKMTFSHQMIRLIFVEQLYRAYTILNNEPYHHE